MRKNGQQVHNYIYRALIPDELVNPDDIKARDGFDTVIREKLCPAASAKDLRVTRRLSHRILISMRMMRIIKLTSPQA